MLRRRLKAMRRLAEFGAGSPDPPQDVVPFLGARLRPVCPRFITSPGSPMKTPLAVAVGTVLLLFSGVVFAQNAGMMNGGWWGNGWMSGGMGGYGILGPVVLAIVVVGLVMWFVKQKRK